MVKGMNIKVSWCEHYIFKPEQKIKIKKFNICTTIAILIFKIFLFNIRVTDKWGRRAKWRGKIDK